MATMKSVRCIGGPFDGATIDIAEEIRSITTPSATGGVSIYSVFPASCNGQTRHFGVVGMRDGRCILDVLWAAYVHGVPAFAKQAGATTEPPAKDAELEAMRASLEEAKRLVDEFSERIRAIGNR